MPRNAIEALYEGDIDKARDLLPPDEELDVFDAAAFGRLERLRQIVEAERSQLTAFSDDGFTALHLAVFAQQEDAVALLIERGADVNALSNASFARVPPLGTAAFVRSVALARRLLDAGADVNGQGEGGFTALHTAAQNGDEPLIRLLLERGADPTIEMSDGRRATDVAADDALRTLLTRGA